MNLWNYFSKFGIADLKFVSDYTSGHDFTQEFNSSGHYTDKKVMKLQALYNFIDNKEEDGGFHVIPGMHKCIKEFTDFTEFSFRSYKGSNMDFIPIFWESCYMTTDGVPDREKLKGIGRYTQRVTAKAGSLIVWSQFLPHGSAPNNSKNLRMAQFLKIGLASQINSESRVNRAKYVSKKLEEANVVIKDDIERKLMGLDV